MSIERDTDLVLKDIKSGKGLEPIPMFPKPCSEKEHKYIFTGYDYGLRRVCCIKCGHSMFTEQNKENKNKMTKQEALDKIKALEDYIRHFENKIGFEDDKIFLLSVEEYNKYKELIPRFNCWWWLRSSGNSQGSAAFVLDDGMVNSSGRCVFLDDVCVRPAIKVKKNTYCCRQKLWIAGYTWDVIDGENGIAIAEVPIATGKFDEKFNVYESSKIRKYLLDWYKNRTSYFGGEGDNL